jgi:DNA helicase-2/ATP-dependent DNA helicase PcrA
MDAMAYLRFLVNDDNVSFLRIANKPNRKLSQKKIDFLKKVAEEKNTSLFGALVTCREEKLFNNEEINNFINTVLDIRDKILPFSPSLSRTLGEILNRTGYRDLLLSDKNLDRIENVRALQQAIQSREEETRCRLEPREYLAEFTLHNELMEENEANAVTLMTIHSAKGLEFPYIICIGCSEGQFPRDKTPDNELEEERRLFYVACSRAQDELLLTSTARNSYKDTLMRPSCFISEVEPGLIKKIKRQ